MLKHGKTALVAATLSALFAAGPASAFAILGTQGNLQLSGNLSPAEMFRWNAVPTVAGVKTIFYRLDPTFTLAERAAIGLAFDTWSLGITAQPNMVPGVFTGDLQSVAVHEIGHALGFGHSGIREEQPPNRFFDTDANPFNAMVNPDVLTL